MFFWINFCSSQGFLKQHFDTAAEYEFVRLWKRRRKYLLSVLLATPTESEELSLCIFRLSSRPLCLVLTQSAKAHHPSVETWPFAWIGGLICFAFPCTENDRPSFRTCIFCFKSQLLRLAKSRGQTLFSRLR